MENLERFNQICAKYFDVLKQNWTPEDMKDIYEAYNILHGTNKEDTGCGTCRRETIINVRDYYLKSKSC